MSLETLRAILWLRWRLTRNAWAKSSGLGAVLTLLFTIAGIGLAVFGFAGAIFTGARGLHGESPAAVMWTWFGVTSAFLFTWLFAVLIDLQRSELVDLPRLMHLPVRLGSAFVVNYVASLIGATIAVFVPVMLGLSLGLAFDRGPAMLLLAPLSLGLVFMVTAWTYLFQGWIATWIQSPRRRRALVSGVVLVVVMIGQLPNLLVRTVERSSSPGDTAASDAQSFACGTETCTADQSCAEPCCGATPHWSYRYAPGLDLSPRDEQGECTPCANTSGPGARKPSCIDERKAIQSMRRTAKERRQWKRIAEVVVPAEKIVPPLWLPAGAEGLARGEPLVALLGTLGFAALGGFALLRGYQSTLRYYTGGDGSSRAGGAPAESPSASGRQGRRLVEWRIVGVHDQTAAVAAATLRSLLRAPEVMMSIGVTLVVLPMSIFVLATTSHGHVELGPHVRPLVVVGAMAIVGLAASQVLNNQFGHDRDGLRALLLAPIARRRILLGKNIAVLVLSGPACAVVLVASALWLGLPPFAGVAALLQAATLLLVSGMVGNLLSIYFAYRIEPGSMKATKPPAAVWLAIFGFLFALPLLYLPALAGPLAVAVGHYVHWRHPVAVDAVVSVLMAIAAFGAYAASLTPLGELLQRREAVLVGRVTSRNE